MILKKHLSMNDFKETLQSIYNTKDFNKAINQAKSLNLTCEYIDGDENSFLIKLPNGRIDSKDTPINNEIITTFCKKYYQCDCGCIDDEDENLFDSFL